MHLSSLSSDRHDQEATVPLGPSTTPRPLHRLQEVRRAEGISRRTMAKRMNTRIDAIADQERSDRDLTLTTLYQWQSILQVPLSDLLVEPDNSLTPEVKRRALMIRIMKTAKVVLEHAHQSRLRRTAQMLVDQLIELMPELREIQPWNEVGQRRTSKDLGAAFYRGAGLQSVLGQYSPEP